MTPANAEKTKNGASGSLWSVLWREHPTMSSSKLRIPLKKTLKSGASCCEQRGRRRTAKRKLQDNNNNDDDDDDDDDEADAQSFHTAAGPS